MLIKNLTEYFVATKVTSRKPPQPEMAIIVRATYTISPTGELAVLTDSIEQRFLSGETYAAGDEADRVGEALYPSDFAEFKLNAEVLLKGHCHAAAGRSLTECLVRFGVGAWSKTLKVWGRRAWSDTMPGAVASQPLAFSKVPLTWANAFGHPGYDKNPVGKGQGDDLPQVEYPSDGMTRRGQTIAPAGFGPISAAWPARASKLGTQYGRAWRRDRAPFYAEDFDWSHFHAAPADQQLEGYLHGDEELTFQNLYEGAPTVRAKLPGARLRVFVADDGGRVREVPMFGDTLLADLDRGRIEVTFRGLVAVRDRDFDDVKTMLVAEEQAADKRQTEAFYKEILAAYERDPVGLNAAFPAGFDDVIKRTQAAERGEPLPEPRAGLDPISAHVDQRLGAFGGEIVDRVTEAVSIARKKADGKRDVDAEIASIALSMDDAPPPMRVHKPGALPPVGLRKQMRDVLEQAANLRQAAARGGVPAEQRAQLEAEAAGLEATPLDPRWVTLDPMYRPPLEPISTDAPGPGKNLEEHDLTGRDLRGLDLRGANLEGATLTRADLSGADLSGANLRDAVLFKTNLENAKLVKADLSRANVARANAKGADFRGAKLHMTFFEDADLSGASLVECDGAYATMTRTNLKGANLGRAHLEHVDATEATIEGADFELASLVAAQFSGCHARKASFARASLAGASFERAELAHASFRQASGDKPIFEGATADSADFAYASFPNAHFTKIAAPRASFLRANLPGSRFYKAKLDDADATQANLFQADLSFAQVSRTRFVGASLYEASFTSAAGQDAVFTDANLKRSTLERNA